MACAICHGEDHSRPHCPYRPEVTQARIAALDRSIDSTARAFERYQASLAWWQRHRRLRLALDFAGLIFGLWAGASLGRTAPRPVDPAAMITVCPVCAEASATPTSTPPDAPPLKPRALSAAALDAGLPPPSPPPAVLPPRTSRAPQVGQDACFHRCYADRQTCFGTCPSESQGGARTCAKTCDSAKTACDNSCR